MGENTKPDIREWMFLVRNSGQVNEEWRTPWEPWSPLDGPLPSPEEPMRDVTHEALSGLSDRSAERGQARLSGPVMSFVDDVLAGRVLTLDDGTSVWLAKKDGAADITGMGRCRIWSFTKGHIVVKLNPGRGAKQAFPYARLAATQGD